MFKIICFLVLMAMMMATRAEDTAPDPAELFAPVTNPATGNGGQQAANGQPSAATTGTDASVQDAAEHQGTMDNPDAAATPDPLPIIEPPKPKKRPSLLDTGKTALPKQRQTNPKTGVTIAAQPGVTESVVIARDKLNRIVTPYANPKVLTTDSLESKVDGNSVYVATASDAPVSLFISDTETGHATSLQLIPDPVSAPVEVRIEADLPNANAGTGLPGMSKRCWVTWQQSGRVMSSRKSNSLS